MRRALYRLSQFRLHLRPRPLGPEGQAEVERLLNPTLAALFRRQTDREKAHALRVVRDVAASGGARAVRPELLQAALLHDVAKSVAPLSLVDRAIVVVVRWLWPAAGGAVCAGLLSRLSRMPIGAPTCAPRLARRP